LQQYWWVLNGVNMDWVLYHNGIGFISQQIGLQERVYGLNLKAGSEVDPISVINLRHENNKGMKP
jgi:hypothetical protein